MDASVRDSLERVLGAGFRLDRELGGGGMSRVFLATDLALDRQVVVKVLSAEQSVGVSGARFRREIQLVAKLQHPHIVSILSAGEADGALYYVMPFLPGESLRARLVREGPLKIAEALGIVRETLDALAFAHAHGVIHRDVKPANILLGGGHAVVADFGVSKALQEAGALTSAGIALGTPTYMAPEQAAADPQADHRADLYSVGVAAYEMLTGAPPFSGTPSQVIKAHLTASPEPVKQRRSDVPDAFADVVMRALAKDPADRPQSAAEMMTALDVVTTPGAALHDPESTDHAPARAIRPALVWAAAIAVALVAWGTWAAFRPTVIRSAQSLAFMPFSVADGDTALVRLGQNLVTTLTANLDGIGELQVADAMAVLSHAKTKGPLLSVSQAIAIARKLDVRSAGYGTLTRSGPNVRADLALYDVRKPKTPTIRVTATAPIDSIAALTDSLTWKLLGEVWTRGRPPTPNVVSAATHSVVALRHFLEGERLFGRFQLDSAAQAYTRAIEADTTFWFAHYRYRTAREWFSNPVDTTIANRLSRHLADLPERERRLLRAIDSTRTISDRQRRLQEILRDNPNYAPALYHYGDYIAHWALTAGWDVSDAIPYFQRLTELMPSDLTSLGHLGNLCLVVGDQVCAQRVLARTDSLANANPSSFFARQGERFFTFALHRLSPNAADSLARMIVTDTIVPSVGFLPTFAGMFAERPDLLNDQDRLYERIAARGRPDLVRPLQLLTSLGRGNGAVLDTLFAQANRMPAEMRAFLQFERTIPEAMILAELQGIREPSARTAEQGLALVTARDARPVDRVSGRWMAGASALLRGDSILLRVQIGELQRDTSVAARTAQRSLAALRIGFSGNHVAAAESLWMIEREHGERRKQQLWVALVADRILGAEWLIESRRYLPADSLLRFSRGMPINPDLLMAAQATFGTAQLLRSRAADSLGNKQDAIAFAKTFLATFDMAPARLAPRLDEARARITRLGGSFDEPRTDPVRVKQPAKQ